MAICQPLAILGQSAVSLLLDQLANLLVMGFIQGGVAPATMRFGCNGTGLTLTPTQFGDKRQADPKSFGRFPLGHFLA